MPFSAGINYGASGDLGAVNKDGRLPQNFLLASGGEAKSIQLTLGRRNVMKRFTKVTIGMFLVFMVGATCVHAFDVKPVKLKFASPWAEHDIAWTYIDKPVWDKVSRMTNGKIRVTTHFMSSLYPPDKCWDSTLMGVSDITTGFVGFDSPGRFPISDLFAVLRMDKRPLRISMMGYEMLHNWPETKREFKGAKMLWLNAQSALWFGSTKKPILSVKDFKGLKVPAPSRWQGRILEKLGMIPVPIPFPDIFMALEKGVVDAMLVDPNLIVKYKFGEVIKYVTDIDFGAGTSYGAMNINSWKKLPREVQAVVEKMYYGRERILEIDTNLIVNHYEMIMEAQKTFGTEFFEFSPEEMEKLVKTVKPVRDEYAAFLDSKGYNGKEILERFDKLTSTYSY
ncbi:MAG: TRAP transporter substrate-binding protein DctP [Deltaproteobacteria bacterium]|nr:TRAP transporter substrate-binding protein DctP [Deltaproteobacteria bacterium]